MRNLIIGCAYDIINGMKSVPDITFTSVLQWSDAECRDFLEIMRWGDSPMCPKCGAEKPYRITRKARNKNQVRKLFKCRKCRRQFSVTVGTIFEDSKIPLPKWFAAIYLMCSSKKGISAHQLHRMLDITYRSAWFMCHRIRNAMQDDTGDPLSGIVEADETYISPRTKRGHPVVHERINDEIKMGLRPKPRRKGPFEGKTAVFGMIERGGRVRSRVVPDTRRATLNSIMLDEIDADATLITDGHSSYRSMHRHMRHEVVDHEIEYVRPDDPTLHTQNIENYWSIFKRALVGTFHHISEGYLPMYLHEFDFRGSRRQVTDAERFALLMAQTQGRLLWYCRTPQQPNPHA